MLEKIKVINPKLTHEDVKRIFARAEEINELMHEEEKNIDNKLKALGLIDDNGHMDLNDVQVQQCLINHPEIFTTMDSLCHELDDLHFEYDPTFCLFGLGEPFNPAVYRY